ncbi:MAG: hypothetical protein RSD36_17465 [Terrisporobacter sp.]
MKEFKTISDLTCNIHLIPQVVATDALKRILDWMLNPEADVNDDYIKRQLSYAGKFIN